MTDALVLLSGGLDSSTLLAYTRPQMALFVDYGQRHIREQEAAVAIAARYGVSLQTLSLTDYGKSVHSALTTRSEIVPKGHYAADNMSATVVPNRNAVLLAAAAGIAASNGLHTVYTAVHAGDHPVYPDCRPEFIQAASHAYELGCGVRVEAPFVDSSKEHIAVLAGQLELPIDLTWSCYEGGTIHCGQCGTCVERLEALHLAQVTDPTVYADTEFWKRATA